MGGGGAPTGVESAVLTVLGFPLVPGIGEGGGILALNSLLWGGVLGFAVPAAWRSVKRGKVAT
jgi:hypothetical protein